MSFNLIQIFLDMFTLISRLEITLHLAGFAFAVLVGALTWKLLLRGGDLP